MMCKYCTFDKKPRDYEITLHKCTSYKYTGKKYFLKVKHPLGTYDTSKWAKPLEVNFCPMCGRKLSEEINEKNTEDGE